MDMSLDEIIERRMSAARAGLGGGGRQRDISGVAGGNSNSISNGSAGIAGGPTRRPAVKRPYMCKPYSKVRKTCEFSDKAITVLELFFTMYTLL